MNISLIQRQFTEAQRAFAIIELKMDGPSSVSVEVALQANDRTYVVSIRFPESYPNEIPKIFVEAPALMPSSPHRYNSGNICFLHPSMWNPGTHDIEFLVTRAAKWLNKYEVWKFSGTWPGKEVKH